MIKDFPTDTSPPPDPAQPDKVRHAEEIARLNHRIDALSGMVESLRAAAKGTDALEHRVLRLCEANQNLVLATFGAQDLQASAEAANLKQTEFLSMLAHELRNPLAPISMANDLIGAIVDAHPQLPQLHAIIARQVRHVARLLDDLLDASRVTSGKITMHTRVMPLSDVIAAAVETSRPFFDKRNQQLVVDETFDPVVVQADAVRLAQALSNLMINASKFSPENEFISITTRKLADSVVVSVRDNGVGIQEDIQESIFNMFVQGFQSIERAQGGLGIGLALVRTVVELHGGTVRAVSKGIGFGSEFLVTLPLSGQPVRAPAAPAPKVAAKYQRVLLIEDNVDANTTLKLLLEARGYSVTPTFDGPAGLMLAQQSDYDIIICDIGLPGMDGFDVVARLRAAAPRVGTRVARCFAVSGYNGAEYRAHALAAGFEHYFVKPIDTDALMALIASSPSATP